MNEVDQLLKTYKGELYDLCFQLLKDTTDKAGIFEYVCRNFRTLSSDESQPIESFFSKEEIEQYISVQGDEVEGLLNSAVKKCNYGIIESEAFYRSLWDTFELNFTGEKPQAFAFYYSLQNLNIPYKYLGKPLTMSNEKYREITEVNREYIDDVKRIVISRYNQRTEEASLLLNILDSVEGNENKTVVLAQAMSIFSARKQIIRKVMEKDDSQKEE